MLEFRLYSKKNKAKNKMSDKTLSDKNNKMDRFTFRVDKELAEKIKIKCLEKDQKFSLLNRILWEAYFKVEENNAWKREVENW